MASLFPDWPSFSVFLVASLAVGSSPGPGMMFAVARGLGQGHKAGAVSVAGLATGSFGLCLLAAVGVAALIAASPLAFNGLRYGGGAYLIYLAWRALARSAGPPGGDTDATRDTLARIYRQGIMTSLLNPKSAVFYLAFVPQFTSPDRGSVLVQFILLGLIFNVMGNLINLAVAFFFGRIGDWLARHKDVWHWQQRFTAVVFIAIAALLVLG